jgi:heme-degrading monooxygenase HmoA
METKPELLRRRESTMPVTREEMDERVTLMDQIRSDGGPIVLINRFNVPADEVERFVDVWSEDAAFMKRQLGFISTQLHRGVAGSTTFVNVATWESARALGAALAGPEFQAQTARYPDGTHAAPHVFERLAVPGICTA